MEMDAPFKLLGGEAEVLAITKAFYDAMEEHEPELTAVHRGSLDAQGVFRVEPEVRERFGLFLIGWLGGPQTYMETHGHPRLRMRHAKVPINEAMRDAWLRAMERALDACEVQGEVRSFLDARFADVANFLRNTEG
jgi:hemoglobin